MQILGVALVVVGVGLMIMGLALVAVSLLERRLKNRLRSWK